MATESIAATVAQGMAGLLGGRSTLGEARGISADSLEGLYGLAYGDYQEGRYAEAESAFRLLCLYDHENPKFWTGLGYARRQLGDHGGAAGALSLADTYAEVPDPERYLVLAECFLAAGDADAARACAQAVVDTARDEATKERARVILTSHPE